MLTKTEIKDKIELLGRTRSIAVMNNDASLILNIDITLRAYHKVLGQEYVAPTSDSGKAAAALATAVTAQNVPLADEVEAVEVVSAPDHDVTPDGFTSTDLTVKEAIAYMQGKSKQELSRWLDPAEERKGVLNAWEELS